jgi:hypothetical protein
MAQVVADRRDLDFVLYEQLRVDELTKLDKYKVFNKKTFDMIITEARNFAVKELLPALPMRKARRRDCNLKMGGSKFRNAFIALTSSCWRANGLP